MIGEVLGGYVIERKLGEGGMGEVYLATHRRISRRAAVKVLHPEFSREPDILNRFFNEARATSVIEHPNIVQVHDCDFHASGRAFIIMEYLRGETLASAIKRLGNLRDDLGAIFLLMRQMASALEAAHAKGIVHRDLKPDNIFLVKGGYGASGVVVKVLDFGIAKLASGVGSASSNTRTGSLLGTPLYMSPEQCRGAPQVDHRADIYSLGCVLFELLAGRPPFQREGAGDLIVAHVTEQPPLLRSLGVDVPAELEDLVQQMLAKSPAQRPSTMADVRAALDALEARTGVRASRLTVVEPADPTSTLPMPGAMTPPVMTPPPGSPTPASMTPAAMVGGTAFLPTPQPGPAGAGSRTPRPKSSSGQGTTPMAHHGQVDTGRRGRAGQERKPPAERRLPVVAWALGAVILVGGVVAVVLWRGGGESTHDTVSREARAVKAETPAVPAVAAPAAVEPPRITIDVESGPPQMTVSVDGLPMAFPLTFSRDGRPHELVFRAPGHRELHRVIEATRDQSLVIAMERAEPERSAPEHPSRDDSAVRAAATRETSKSRSSRASAAAASPPATSKPDKAQAKPASPARRLPAVITDID